MKEVPASLRVWFVIHFIADYLFAIPLFIAPTWFLSLFGFTIVDPVTARLAAAALFAVGGISLLAFKGSAEVYYSLLQLKLIWSISATVGLLLSLWQGASILLWFVVIIFSLFSGIWSYYLWRLR